MQAILALALFSCLPQGGGSSSTVVLNEVQYDDSGSGSDAREFVELFNRTASPIDISNWVLETQGPGGIVSSFTVPASTTLNNGDWYVFGPATLPNVDQVVGSLDIWGDSNNSMILRDSGGTVIDSLTYESNKGISGGMLAEGEGIWGNFRSQDLRETSWSRIRDGWDSDNNGFDFALYPATPGTSNNLTLPSVYIETFEGQAVGSSVTEWTGTFADAIIIDPTVSDTNNPSAIPASTQGGQAVIMWDSAGGGNAHQLLVDGLSGNIVLECEVYLDATLEIVGNYETWSLGIGGSTGTFANHADPSGSLSATANGNTGVCWVYQVTDASATLYLVDCNDGGWGATAITQPTVIGQINIVPGSNDGWQRLRLEMTGDKVIGSFGNTFGCADGTSFSANLDYARPTYGVYVGYREFVTDNSTTRPFTADDFFVRTSQGATEIIGVGKATTQGTPNLDTNGPATVGYTGFQLLSSGLVPSGNSTILWGGTQLTPPFDMSLAGGQVGSFLHFLPFPTDFPQTATGSGTAVRAFPLPCNLGFIGQSLFFEIFDVDGALGVPLPLGNSNALKVTLGG